MTDPWTSAWAEAQASPDPLTRELLTVELIHPAIVDAAGVQTTIRAVSDNQGHTLLLEDSALASPGQRVDFIPCPFQVPWPDTEDGNTPQMRLRIDGVGRELVPHLAAAVKVNAPLQVIFRVYLWTEAGGDLGATEGMDPMTIVLRQVTVSEQYVEGTASPADLANLQFLRVIYDVGNYPALTQ